MVVYIVAYILWEAHPGVFAPVEVRTGPTPGIAIAGSAINAGSICMLQGGEMSLEQTSACYPWHGDVSGPMAGVASVVGIEVSAVSDLHSIMAALVAADPRSANMSTGEAVRCSSRHSSNQKASESTSRI